MLDYFKDLTYFSPLPGERELCDIFGVSRPTVRKVLQILEMDNSLVRLQGRGTFFLGNKIHVDGSGSEKGIAFYDEVVSRGRYTRSKILTQNVEKTSSAIAAQLNIGVDEDVFHLERLRYIGAQLYSLANAYIPLKLCPDLLREDFTDQSLYATLEKYGICPYRQKRVLEIKPANQYEALHLEIREGDPVSIMQALTFTEDDMVIECAISKSLAYNTRYEMMLYNLKRDKPPEK